MDEKIAINKGGNKIHIEILPKISSLLFFYFSSCFSDLLACTLPAESQVLEKKISKNIAIETMIRRCAVPAYDLDLN